MWRAEEHARRAEGEKNMDGSVDLLVLGDSWAAVDHGWPTLIAHDLKLKTVLGVDFGGVGGSVDFVFGGPSPLVAARAG
jgi:hypothetical protein